MGTKLLKEISGVRGEYGEGHLTGFLLNAGQVVGGHVGGGGR